MAERTVLELCTGGGGQAIGLETAGFTGVGYAEIDGDCCETLTGNRKDWPVFRGDIADLPASWLQQGFADLVAGGLPCTPHTRGGKQLGDADERHLWDTALGIIRLVHPRAVMLETSNAILTAKFDDERARTLSWLYSLGYQVRWDAIDCSQFGVPQQRKRAVLVGLRDASPGFLPWPEPATWPAPSVGTALYELAAANGWPAAATWASRATGVAPTVVGGSRKHGGADLGATQGKAAWRRLGIDPMGIADAPPGPEGKYPRGKGITGDAGQTGLMLTVEMAARLQGFPPDWKFSGYKTSRYRQVGNAFPPPAAARVGVAIAAALNGDN